jgi:hypothetical protein
MEPMTAATFLIGLTIVVLLLGLFYGPWQTFVITTTRQFIFELRDTWFDVTAFDLALRDLEATRRVRASLNGTIEITDLFTWPTFLAIIYLRSSKKSSRSNIATHPLRGMPHGDVQRLGHRLLHYATIYLLGQMLARSILLAPLGIYFMVMTRRHAHSTCVAGLAPQFRREHIYRGIVRRVERATIVLEDSRFKKVLRPRGPAIAA